MITALIVLYIYIHLTCAAFTASTTMAEFWYEFPLLQDENYLRENAGFGWLFGIVFGPFAFFVVFFLTGFARHGWLDPFCLKEPKKLFEK